MGNKSNKSTESPPKKNDEYLIDDPKNSEPIEKPENNKKEETKIMETEKPISDAIDRRFESNETREKFLKEISARGLNVQLYDRKGNPYMTFSNGTKKGNSTKLSETELKEISEASIYLPEKEKIIKMKDEDIIGERSDPSIVLPKRVFYYLISFVDYQTIGNGLSVNKKWNSLLESQEVWKYKLSVNFPWVQYEPEKAKKTYLELIEREWNPKTSITFGSKKFILIPQRINGICFGKKLQDSFTATTTPHCIVVLTNENYYHGTVDLILNIKQFLLSQGF